MKVLVACEFSGRVRDAFQERGHDAWSCDLLPAEGNHFQRNVLEILDEGWDLMIAHPPCTYLATSGARHMKGIRLALQRLSVEFVKRLWNCKIPKIAIENPVGVLSTKMCKPTQIVQPYWFGEYESKATCLWLKGLPKLEPTNMVEPVHKTLANLSASVDRRKERSITFKGFAKAMAQQWG